MGHLSPFQKNITAGVFSPQMMMTMIVADDSEEEFLGSDAAKHTDGVNGRQWKG